MAAAARVVEIAAMKDEDAKNRAMLAEVTSPNLPLQDVAQRYVALKMSSSTHGETYKRQLMELLANDNPGVQRTALSGLRFADAGDAIPRMIALTRSEDVGVIECASLALGKYDTQETVAALIALTRDARPRLRSRAALDVSNCRRPEVKPALAALLDDPDADVRSTAANALVYMLRNGTADDLIPRLAAMLEDPDERVIARAADALGETRNPAAIAPLLTLLQRPGLAREPQRTGMSALYRHYSRNQREAGPIIETHIDLVIAAVKAGEASDAFGPAFHAMGILASCPLPAARAALEWAAQSHPNAEIRGYAQRSLKR